VWTTTEARKNAAASKEIGVGTAAELSTIVGLNLFDREE